eukprot:gene29891-38526_t
MDDTEHEEPELLHLVCIIAELAAADDGKLDDDQIWETITTINEYVTDLEAELPWDAEDIRRPMSTNLEKVLGRSTNSNKDDLLYIKIGGYHGIGTGTLGMDWQAPAAPGLDNSPALITYVEDFSSLMSSYVSRNTSRKGSVDLSSKYEDFEDAAVSALAVFDPCTDSDIFPIIDSHSDLSSWNNKTDGAFSYPSNVDTTSSLDEFQTFHNSTAKRPGGYNPTADKTYFPPIK